MFKKNLFKVVLISSMFISILVGCNNEENVDDNQTTDTTENVQSTPTDCSDVHWGYDGDEGPEHWADLCTGFSACGHQSQSPVNITGATDNDQLTPIEVSYSSTSADIVNNGHTVQFNCAPGSKINVNGTEYELLQFHYHGLSEHQVDGQHFPLEVHFVHKATDDNFAVLGIFFEEGDENKLFADFLAHFPHQEGEYSDENISIDLSSLLPQDMSYYYYSGSLTTPPCSEVVNWYVLKNTVTASADQIAEFQAILHDNYRPVQDLNGRSITMFNE